MKRIIRLSGTSYKQENIKLVMNHEEELAGIYLRREKNNQFDEYAVSVYIGPFAIGYIPKGVNVEVAKFLDVGGIYKIIEIKYNTSYHFSLIGIEIEIEELGKRMSLGGQGVETFPHPDRP